MSDLIDRQAAIAAADRADYTEFAVEDVKTVTDEVVKELKALPAIDAEPVVRCEFCVKKGNALACPYSVSTGELPDPQDYCSMGVRKKDGIN